MRSHIEEIEALSAERDRLKVQAETAEASVVRCKREYARLRGEWLKLVDTVAIYQPVIDAAVAWASQFGDGDRAMQGLFEAVRTFQAARHKGFCNKDRLSRIDGLTMKTESEAPEGPDDDEEWVVIDIMGEAARERPTVGSSHPAQPEKSCATCLHLEDGEMCDLSGAGAKFCLENAFSNWRPIDVVKSRVEASLQSLGIIERNGAVDGMGPNGPVLREMGNHQLDKIDLLERMLSRAAELEKACRIGVWGNWQPKE